VESNPARAAASSSTRHGRTAREQATEEVASSLLAPSYSRSVKVRPGVDVRPGLDTRVPDCSKRLAFGRLGRRTPIERSHSPPIIVHGFARHRSHGLFRLGRASLDTQGSMNQSHATAAPRAVLHRTVVDAPQPRAVFHRGASPRFELLIERPPDHDQATGRHAPQPGQTDSRS